MNLKQTNVLIHSTVLIFGVQPMYVVGNIQTLSDVVKFGLCPAHFSNWNTEQWELTSRQSNREWAQQFPLFLYSDAVLV